MKTIVCAHLLGRGEVALVAAGEALEEGAQVGELVARPALQLAALPADVHQQPLVVALEPAHQDLDALAVGAEADHAPAARGDACTGPAARPPAAGRCPSRRSASRRSTTTGCARGIDRGERVRRVRRRSRGCRSPRAPRPAPPRSAAGPGAGRRARRSPPRPRRRSRSAAARLEPAHEAVELLGGARRARAARRCACRRRAGPGSVRSRRPSSGIAAHRLSAIRCNEVHAT